MSMSIQRRAQNRRTFVSGRLPGSCLLLLLLLERSVVLVIFLLILLGSLHELSNYCPAILKATANLQGLQLATLPAGHDGLCEGCLPAACRPARGKKILRILRNICLDLTLGTER